MNNPKDVIEKVIIAETVLDAERMFARSSDVLNLHSVFTYPSLMYHYL